MRSHRGGHEVWMCEVCFDVASPDADGWYEDHENAIPGRPGLSPPNNPKHPPVPVVTADQPLHYCPEHTPPGVVRAAVAEDYAPAMEPPPGEMVMVDRPEPLPVAEIDYSQMQEFTARPEHPDAL